jgi:hypothetical protein
MISYDVLLKKPSRALLALFALYVVVVIIVNVWVTGISLKRPRKIQITLDIVIMPAKYILFRKAVSKQQFNRSDVSLFFRVNGYPPEPKEYQDLAKGNFARWKLKVCGLVEKPMELSLADLHTMRKHS